MIRGALKKRGGAYSLVFGSTAWKERYFVSEAGVLTYYSAEEAVHSKKGAKKGWKINLRYYGVNSMPSDPRRFALVPTPDAFTAYTHAAGVGMPPPDRVFEFEAPNEHIKRNWTEALRGKAVEVEKDEGGVHDDTNEEVEAQRAAMKAAAHRTAGRGVYRIASKAAIQKGGAADKVKKAMEVSGEGGLEEGPRARHPAPRRRETHPQARQDDGHARPLCLIPMRPHSPLPPPCRRTPRLQAWASPCEVVARRGS